MALTVTARGTGTHNTGATTLVPGGRSATFAVGSMGVLAIAADNAGSGGAATMGPATATDSKGNVWTRRLDIIYDNGAASAGIEAIYYTAPITTAFLTSDTLTLTWSPAVSPVAKGYTWYEVTPSAGKTVVFSTSGSIAGATAANATVVTGSIPVGDAVIAGYFAEGVSAVTQDSDTTNGAWAAQQTTTIGATTSGVRIATQAKVQTTAASTQSYDVTVASQDRIAGYIVLHEQPTGVVDDFARTVGAGNDWGAGTEITWSKQYPLTAETEWSVASGKGLLIQSTLGNTFAQQANWFAPDADLKFMVRTDKLAVGQPQEILTHHRWTDVSNYFNTFVRFNTNQTISAGVNRTQGGTWSNRAADTVIGGLTHAANTDFWIRVQVDGATATPQFRIKVWQDGSSEPGSWSRTYTDSGATLTGTAHGIGEYMETGTTNTPVTFSHDSVGLGIIGFNDVTGEHYSGSGSMSQAHTMTASGTKGAVGTGTMVVVASTPATGTSARAGTGAFSQAHTMPATGVKAAANVAAESQAHTMTASGVAAEVHSGTASMTVTSSMTASGTKQGVGVGTIAQTHSMTYAQVKAAFGTGTINQAHTAVASGVALEFHSGTASLSQANSTVATGLKAAAGAGTDGATVGMTATGTVAESHSGAGSMDVASSMTASGVAARVGAGAIAQGYSQTYDGYKTAFAVAATSATTSMPATGATGRAGQGATSLTTGMPATGVAGRSGAGTAALAVSDAATGSKQGFGVASMAVGVSMTTGVGKQGTAEMTVFAFPIATGTSSRAAAIAASHATAITGVGAKGSSGSISASHATSITGTGVAGRVGSRRDVGHHADGLRRCIDSRRRGWPGGRDQHDRDRDRPPRGS